MLVAERMSIVTICNECIGMLFSVVVKYSMIRGTHAVGCMLPISKVDDLEGPHSPVGHAQGVK